MNEEGAREERPSLEQGMARVEGILEENGTRLDHVESQIQELRREMHSNFRWTLGITIAAWVTIIAAILGLIFTL